MQLRALILPSLLLVMNLPAQAQTRALCCNDAAGRRTCGDTLPQICYERAYSEIVGGRVVRTVEAPMTPEQRARKDAELRTQRDKLASEATERRRDQVLLDSYASVSELDRRRDRDIGNLEGEIRASRAREADLMALNAKLEKQIPANGKVPRILAENISTNTAELESIRLVMASKQREIEQMRIRFDADRKRYIELNGGPGTPH
jgi:hypothetical protein